MSNIKSKKFNEFDDFLIMLKEYNKKLDIFDEKIKKGEIVITNKNNADNFNKIYENLEKDYKKFNEQLKKKKND